MSGSQHNVVGMVITFDFTNKTIAFDVHMQNNPGLNVIQRRAEEKGLLSPENHVLAAIRYKRRSVEITLSGPTLYAIYRALPFSVTLSRKAMKRLTLPQVDAYIEAFNKRAVTKVKPRLNAKDLMDIVAALCA